MNKYNVWVTGPTGAHYESEVYATSLRKAESKAIRELGFKKNEATAMAAKPYSDKALGIKR